MNTTFKNFNRLAQLHCFKLSLPKNKEENRKPRKHIARGYQGGADYARGRIRTCVAPTGIRP